MKSHGLVFLGIGLPLGLMMVVWRYLDHVSLPAERSHAQAVSTAAPQPVKRGDPVDLRLFPAPEREPVSGSGETANELAGGWTDTVSAWLDQLLQAARRDPDLQRKAAATLLQQGRYAEAAEAFDRLLVRDADDPALLSGKAMALTAMDEHEDAMILFAAALRARPQDATLQFNHAVSLLRCGETDKAAAAFKKLLEAHPGHVQAMYNLAILRQAAGQNAEALELWRQLTDGDTTSRPAAAAQELSPRMLAGAWAHRGELALELKHPQEAETCFLNVVRLEPRNATAWCNVGIARAAQVRRDDALTALQIALQLDPDLVPALNQAAYIHAALYRDLGHAEHGQAVADYCRRSLRANPRQPNIIELLRAASWFDRGERDAATSNTDEGHRPE
ncbi:MAG TPA: tetratricopeptide repeat protein [Phycisphaerae bacterium]|nr:tetratricopeptide repeat protein [Phycisphaerae bacterium]